MRIGIGYRFRAGKPKARKRGFYRVEGDDSFSKKKRPSGGQKSVLFLRQNREEEKNADTENFPSALLVRSLKKEGGKAVFCRGQEEGNSVRKEAKYAQKEGNPPKTRGISKFNFLFRIDNVVSLC